MAGIGFSLRRLGHGGGFTGLGKLYGAAGLISSGPWLISIITILFTGLWTVELVPERRDVPQFQVSVTYLFAGSLILSGPLQLLFSRLTADRVFEERNSRILPNLFGAMVVTGAAAGVVGTVVMFVGFAEQSLFYRIVMVECFIVLCDLWLVVVLLTALKFYGSVLASFAGAYGIILGCAILLAPYGLEGLLAGFAIGQAFLLFVALFLILRQYPSDALIAFDFFDREQVFPSLAVTGFLFNYGVWIDKFLFWANPRTSEPMIGLFRGSYLYDIPVLLAYLTVVPGMSVFLIRLETDFAEHYTAFYDAVREGAPLERIEQLRDNMTVSAKRGIFEILKVQGLVFFLIILFARNVLPFFGISELFLPLLYVHAAAVGVQVLLLAVLNVFFYLDQRGTALRICLIFAVLNTVGTIVTQKLGYVFYGYGFAIAVAAAALVGLALLNRRFDGLVRDTFMLQGVDA
ncbi:MAG: exopolysaccharide Pel transporter PelG [Proteobacteria bacterium]|nr:exopolysaccharide Pel transporter PelG [Pseudomonadota bacterium]